MKIESRKLILSLLIKETQTKQDAIKVVLEQIAKQFRKKIFYKGEKKRMGIMLMIKTREPVHLFTRIRISTAYLLKDKY